MIFSTIIIIYNFFLPIFISLLFATVSSISFYIFVIILKKKKIPFYSNGWTRQMDQIKFKLPSKPANASLSTYVIWLPSNSSEFNWVKWLKTLAGTLDSWLCANINESKFFRPDLVLNRFWMKEIFKIDFPQHRWRYLSRNFKCTMLL